MNKEFIIVVYKLEAGISRREAEKITDITEIFSTKKNFSNFFFQIP
jgi:hypothetical protein